MSDHPSRPSHRPDRPDEPTPPSLSLDAYLDEQLSPEQAESVEAGLASRPDLQARVELQRQIDASLRRSFARENLAQRNGLASHNAPTFKLTQPAPAATTAPPAGATPSRRLNWFPLAAMLALAASAAVYFIAIRPLAFTDPATLPVASSPTSFEVTYHRIVSAGLVPDEVCTSDEAFSKWMGDRYEAPMVISPKPDGLTLVGWSYPSGIPGYVGALLATQSEKPTIIFIQPRADGVEPVRRPFDPALEQHFREYKGLLFYQLAPKGTPNLLPRFTGA